MPLNPTVYARLLAEKVRQHNVKLWMINTGWTGGPYGQGSRMKLAYTRAMVNAALNGLLDGLEFVTDPVFGFAVPKAVPDVPPEVLLPRNTWRDPSAYDTAARELVARAEKYMQQFAGYMTDEIRAAAPQAP
jgi:phosphoenolpyruvate carboxykinase (ATP)